MKCMHINIRTATFILLTVLANRIQMEENQQMTRDQDNSRTNVTMTLDKISSYDLVLHCPVDLECKELNETCINCNLNKNCEYGNIQITNCTKKSQVNCKGETTFSRSYICRYCYQTEYWEHSCELMANCNSVASPRATYVTNCTVREDILCLGNRTFKKKVKCNWTGGYRWSTALALSITLGGFGADRFYLGHWQEGIGKLFSFGGLGVWTIIDVILISLHYLGPADGSLYI